MDQNQRDVKYCIATVCVIMMWRQTFAGELGKKMSKMHFGMARHLFQRPVAVKPIHCRCLQNPVFAKYVNRIYRNDN